MTATASPPALPADFAWHQSSAKTMLECPERFRLRYVEQIEADHRATDYAAQLGTADHAGMEHILGRVQAGEAVDREDLLDAVLEGFEAAVARAQDQGATFDPDGLERAHERLEGERLERLVLLGDDPRLRSVDWRGIEWRFKFSERAGRVWQGTLDAWGVALEDVEDFGALGRDPVVLRAGDGILVDWKSGELPPFDFVARVRNVQLGVYGMALARAARRGEVVADVGRWRTFLGAIPDVERPKAPTDDQGKRIPKSLPKAINPAWATAAGLSLEEAARFKGRPKGIPRGVDKWLPEQPNPAYERAIAQPKGPVFREAIVRYELVLDTIRAAIRQAELGIYPAAGAVTGQCGRCPYASVCTAAPQEEDKE